MAVRFRCEKCSYQIVLQFPRPDGATCPSCRVALLREPEAPDAVMPPPLPPAAIQRAPTPPPAAPPPITRPARPDRLLLCVGAVVGAVAVASLLVTGVLGWIAHAKQLDRTSAGNNRQPLPRWIEDTPAREAEAPPPPPEKYAPAPKAPRPAPVAPQNHEPPRPEPPPAKPEVNEAPPARAAGPFKRRDKSSEEDLRKQLLAPTEVALDDVPGSSARLQKQARNLSNSGIPFQGPASLVSSRSDLQGLPLRMGLDCQLGKEPAENMHALSRKMRALLEKVTPKDGVDSRPDAAQLRDALLSDPKADWLQAGAVPCLLQLLQAENSPMRKVLVEVLGKIADRRATEALAMRALTDLSPDVREAAARQLIDRPREDYEPLLLAGLRYPWAPVATHAAEALVYLGDRDAVPQLVSLLEQPDATLPFTVRQGGKDTTVVREVVRINHLSNCLLCHPASAARTDLVRGAVPEAGKPLPPPTSSQYYDNGTIFVRADTTYLKQDFSVVQPVDRHGEWPRFQRFDYVVRTRLATAKELEEALRPPTDRPPSEAREAVLFALRELTGKDLGTTARGWAAAVGSRSPAKGGTPLPEEQVGSDWKQFVVAAAPERDASSAADAWRLKRDLLAAPAAAQEKLLTQLADAKGSPYTDALAEAAAQLSGPAQARARDLLAERLARLTDTALHDRFGADDAEMRRAAARAAGLRKAKALIPDLLPLLSDADVEVIQAARLALKAMAGRDFGPAPNADAAARDKAAAEWYALWKKQSGS